MATRTIPIESGQRTAARVAAAAYLVPVAGVVYANFGLRGRLFVEGDMAETIRRVAAGEALFRLSVGLDLVYCIGAVALAAALYVVLSPVQRLLSLLGLVWQMVYAFTAVLTTLSFLYVVRLASDETYAAKLGAEPLQALAQFHWFATSTQYYVGLAFWALASTAFAWLWFRSGYVPAGLAIFGVASSAWCVLCAVAYIVEPGFKRLVNLWWFDVPMAVFLAVLSFWLLFRGLRSPAAASES